MTVTGVSSRRAHTRDRLLDAAVALIAEKGVLGASVEEICERAGFTRGAFYSNFESRDDLLVALLERKGEQILAAATNAISSIPADTILAGTADDVIRRAMAVFEAGHPIDAEWLVARSDIRLYALRNPATLAALRRVEADLDGLLIAAIQGVVDTFGVELSLPPEQVVRLLNSYYEALGMEAVIEGRDPLGERTTERVATLVRALLKLPEGG